MKYWDREWRSGIQLAVRTKSPKTFIYSDLFDSNLAQVWARMLLAPDHTFLVLTENIKRTKRILISEEFGLKLLLEALDLRKGRPSTRGIGVTSRIPAENIWIGVRVSTQREAEEKIPILLDIPAAHRWIELVPTQYFDLLAVRDPPGFCRSSEFSTRNTPLGSLDQVVVSADMGLWPKPCHLKWVRTIIDQCRDAGTHCFIHRLGRNAIETDEWGYDVRFKTSRDGSDSEQWPEDIRVRDLAWPVKAKRPVRTASLRGEIPSPDGED